MDDRPTSGDNTKDGHHRRGILETDSAAVVVTCALSDEVKLTASAANRLDSGIASLSLKESRALLPADGEPVSEIRDEFSPGVNDINYTLQDEDGDTILHNLIITNARPEVIDYVISCLAVNAAHHLDIQNSLHQTSLHLAAAQRNSRAVRRLVASGASLLLVDRRGDTAVHVMCKMLANATSAAEEAASEGCFEALLPARGASSSALEAVVQTRNFNGDTCMHLAARSRQNDVMRRLIDAFPRALNCQEGRRGAAILHEAVDRGNTELVAMLTAVRPRSMLDINLLTYDRKTALDIAISRRHDDIRSLLVDAGAVSAKDIFDVSGSSSSSSSSDTGEEEMC